MNIRLLGTGTPAPSLARMSAGYLVRVGTDVILFDHGPGAHHRLLEAGVSAREVTHLFFSHLHYDHCVDYPRLLLTHWDQGAGKVPELRVYGPPPLKRMTDLLIGRKGAFAPDLAARIGHPASIDTYRARGGRPPRRWPRPQVRELKSGAAVRGRGWRARAIRVPHVEPWLASLAFRLDAEGRSFVYSGDSAPSNALARLAADCDVLVHMCHTLSGTAPFPTWDRAGSGHLEAARIAAQARARSLVLSHISAQMDAPGVRERVVREVAAVYSGDIFFGEDLMEIPLGGPRPAPLR